MVERAHVVVVGFNNRELLEECFASVAAQTHPDVRLIYVDNGSDDGSLAWVRATHPDAIAIDAGANLGFAAANNLGIARALRDPACAYVVALNTDARLAPGWVARVAAFARAHPDAAALQGATYAHERPDEVDSLGIYVSALGIPTQIAWRRTDVVPADGEVFGVGAAAAAYTRAFLERQPFAGQWFDEDLFMYYEDVDLSARALTMGMRNYLVAGARATHIGSATAGVLSPFKIRLGYRNVLLVMIKNLPAQVLVPMLLARLLLEPALLVFYLAVRRSDLARAMVCGRLESLRLIPRFVAKRRVLRPGRDGVTDYRRLTRPPSERGLVRLELQRRLRRDRGVG